MLDEVKIPRFALKWAEMEKEDKSLPLTHSKFKNIFQRVILDVAFP